jgi:hypothetical protein
MDGMAGLNPERNNTKRLYSEFAINLSAAEHKEGRKIPRPTPSRLPRPEDPPFEAQASYILDRAHQHNSSLPLLHSSTVAKFESNSPIEKFGGVSRPGSSTVPASAPETQQHQFHNQNQGRAFDQQGEIPDVQVCFGMVCYLSCVFVPSSSSR